jgi:putative membrane protein
MRPMDAVLALIRDHPPVAANLLSFLLLALAERGFLRTAVWLATGTFVGWLMEFSSTQTGFPFGMYSYHQSTYPNDVWIGGVPLFASLSFAALTYFGYSAAWTLLSPLRWEGANLRRLEVPGLLTSVRLLVVAAVLITWMDLVMDPVTHLGRYWFLGDLYHYDPPGIHFDVPLVNYAGWLFTSATIVFVNQMADRLLTKAGYPAAPAFELPLQPLWSIGCQTGTYLMMLVVNVYLMTSERVPPETPLGGILVSGLFFTAIYGLFVFAMLRPKLVVSHESART